MDSLFKRTLDGEPHEHDSPEVKIQNVTYDLKESNVNLKLTVVETVGYGKSRFTVGESLVGLNFPHFIDCSGIPVFTYQSTIAGFAKSGSFVFPLGGSLPPAGKGFSHFLSSYYS